MNIVIIDGQGGGIGRALVEALRRALPEQEITAVGANALATSAMLRAGATTGATGENAAKVCAKTADIIAGPIGIVLKDAMLGEITEHMAAAIGASSATRVLVPVHRCATYVAGTEGTSLQALIEDAVKKIIQLVNA